MVKQGKVRKHDKTPLCRFERDEEEEDVPCTLNLMSHSHMKGSRDAGGGGDPSCGSATRYYNARSRYGSNCLSSAALRFTTSRRILARASTDDGPEKGDLM